MDGPGGTDEHERAAYRAFVRAHHPDRGGDPEVFVAGLARFHAQRQEREDRRYDAPIEIVRDMPLPVRVAVCVIRTVKRRRQIRVDRPPPPEPVHRRAR
ncbi:MAG: hypothetical protein OJJ54_01295 [Pseudonocardia sp.]|nr:hypothetical protein [Pseudonocardia sp.]